MLNLDYTQSMHNCFCSWLTIECCAGCPNGMFIIHQIFDTYLAPGRPNLILIIDMDKIFSNKSDLPEDTDTAQEVTELAELVLIVLNLRDKVKTLENEVTVLQGDNADLRMRLEEISAPVALTAPGQQQPHRQRQTTLQTTAATADSQVPPDGVATDLTPKFPQQNQDTRVEEPHRSLAESSSSSDSESSDSGDSSSGSEVYIPVRRKSGRNRKTKQAAPTRELSAAKKQSTPQEFSPHWCLCRWRQWV